MKELRDYYETNSARASDYIVEPQQGQICCSSRLEDGERRWYRTVINSAFRLFFVLISFVFCLFVLVLIIFHSFVFLFVYLFVC